ncbi:MAG: site-specific integrase, partial [Thermomicrobiales bacterium]
LTTERKWGPLFAVLATTGLRFSEAIGLRWSDVDWDAGTVRVEQTVVWSHGEFHILPPKTKAGRRTVSLTQPAVRALRRLEHECSPEIRIFRTETGAPPRHSDIRLFLHDLCDEAGVPRINIHGLRHVAAMLAFEAVDDIYLVQQRLGHSHVGVTLAVYGYPARNESVVAPEIDRLLQATPSADTASNPDQS